MLSVRGAVYKFHLLFGRIVELVLVGAAEALLDSHVGPEPLHGRQQLLGEGFRVLHPLDHVEHHLRVRLQQPHMTIRTRRGRRNLEDEENSKKKRVKVSKDLEGIHRNEEGVD